jgi:hypothetical protein
MRKLHALLLLWMIGLLPLSAHASGWNTHLPQAQLVGEYTFSKYIWDIYHISLYAPEAKWEEGKPMALQLRYQLAISGADIAERSAEEMRNIGFKDEVRLAAWFSQMRNIFPDVRDGTILTGVLTADGQTIFYQNDKEIGHVQDSEFGRWFFGIWLNKATSEPTMRKNLLGDYAR